MTGFIWGGCCSPIHVAVAEPSAQAVWILLASFFSDFKAQSLKESLKKSKGQSCGASIARERACLEIGLMESSS